MRVNEQELKRAVDAALTGPGVQKIRVSEHEFNIDPAVKTEGPGIITVNGMEDGNNISHHVAVVRDDQVRYKFTVRVGDQDLDMSDIHLQVERRGWLELVAYVVKWIIEHIEDILEIFQDTTPGTTVAEIRQQSDIIRRKSDELLDGSWEAEASFIILNIALVAAGQQLVKSRPMFLSDLGQYQMVTEIHSNAVRFLAQEATVTDVTDRFSDLQDD